MLKHKVKKNINFFLDFFGILTMKKAGLNIITVFTEQRVTAHGYHYAHLKGILFKIKEYNQLSKTDSWGYSAYKVFHLRIFSSKRPKFF
jgi:hypothetical protein